MSDVWSQYGEEFSGGRESFKKPWSAIDNNYFDVGILTQMGELRSDPEGWFRGIKRHWGYQIRRKDDPTKLSKITFKCLERRGKGGIVIEPCPQDVKYEGQENAAKDYEVQLRREKKANGQPYTEDEIKNLMQPMAGWLRSFSRENKVWMYGMNAAGEFNKVVTSWKTFFQLRDAMNEIEAELKINPRSPRNLVFWRIKRTGTSKNVGQMTDSVERVRETVEINGRRLEQVKIVALTEDQMRKGLESYRNLEETGTYDLSYQQIQALTECNEDPEAVEQILNIPSRTSSSPPPRAATPPPVTPPAASPPAPTPPPPVAPASTEEDEEAAAAREAIALVRARKAEREALAKVEQAATVTTVDSLSTTSPPPAPAPSAERGAESRAALLSRLGLKKDDLKK